MVKEDDAERQRRWWRWALVAALLWTAVVSLVPVQSLPSVGIRDKVAHAFTYAVLMTLALKAALMPRAWQAGGMVMLFGLAIEWLQGLGGYRSAEFLDAVANLVGILAAGGAAWVARQIRGARR